MSKLKLEKDKKYTVKGFIKVNFNNDFSSYIDRKYEIIQILKNEKSKISITNDIITVDNNMVMDNSFKHLFKVEIGYVQFIYEKENVCVLDCVEFFTEKINQIFKLDNLHGSVTRVGHAIHQVQIKDFKDIFKWCHGKQLSDLHLSTTKILEGNQKVKLTFKSGHTNENEQSVTLIESDIYEEYTEPIILDRALSNLKQISTKIDTANLIDL